MRLRSSRLSGVDWKLVWLVALTSDGCTVYEIFLSGVLKMRDISLHDNHFVFLISSSASSHLVPPHCKVARQLWSASEALIVRLGIAVCIAHPNPHSGKHIYLLSKSAS